MLNKSVFVVVALMLLLAGGCSKETPLTSQPEETQPPATEETPYTLEAKVAAAHAGQEGTLLVQVTPGDGFKWNDEFPAQITVKPADRSVVSFSRKEWLKDAFKVEKSAKVSMPYQAKRVGKTDVTLQVRFSVCDAERCLIKDETLVSQVEVLSE